MKTLIRGGCVLTLGARTPNFAEADVLLEDGRIAEIGRGLRDREAEPVDATNAIVMPGFVDTHRHVWKSLFRNTGESGSDSGTSADRRHHGPDDVYAATLIGLLGAVEAGITTVVDWCDVRIDDRSTEAALQAHADAGVRTVFVHPAPEGAADKDDHGSVLRRLAANGAGPATTTVASGMDPTDADGVERDWALPRELGLRIHAHAGTTTDGRGVISALGAKGLLGEDVTLVHCSQLDDADLDAVSTSGASVSLAPASEMAGGLGSPPIQKLIDRRIRPGLAVDDERVAPGDLFAQMRAVISIQHATVFDLKLAGKAGLPHLLTTRDVIRYATADGARVAGLGAVIGSLEPGKQADVVLLRTDRPNIFPINDPIGAVVWGMDTSNVDWVFVAGRAVMRNGTLESDVGRARVLATEAQRRVASAGGIAVAAVPGPER